MLTPTEPNPATVVLAMRPSTANKKGDTMQSFREGTRVRYVGMPGLGPKRGSEGRVATVPVFGGRSVHPDPLHMMTFVEWDDGHSEAVYTNHLERVR